MNDKNYTIWPAAQGTVAIDGEYKVTVNGHPVDVVYIPKPCWHDDQLNCEEAEYYLAHFVPPYGMTLDEISK